jgi:hypothetical protein
MGGSETTDGRFRNSIQTRKRRGGIKAMAKLARIWNLRVIETDVRNLKDENESLVVMRREDCHELHV